MLMTQPISTFKAGRCLFCCKLFAGDIIRLLASY